MSLFEDRKSSAETKFVLDSAMEFKAQARRNKRLGLWAAGRMGLKAEEHDAYAQSVIIADMEEAGDEDVLRKISRDFAERKVACDDAAIRTKMDEILFEVRREIADEA